MYCIIPGVLVLLLGAIVKAQFNTLAGDNSFSGLPFPNRESIVANIDLPKREDFRNIDIPQTKSSFDSFGPKPENFPNSTVLIEGFIPHSPSNDSYSFGIPLEVSSQNTATPFKKEQNNLGTENLGTFESNIASSGKQLSAVNFKKEVPAIINKSNLENTTPLSDIPPHEGNENNYSFGIPLENSFLTARSFQNNFQSNPVIATGSFSTNTNPPISSPSLPSDLSLPPSSEREIKFSPISLFAKRDTASVSPSSYDVPIVPWIHYLKSTSYGDPIID